MVTAAAIGRSTGPGKRLRHSFRRVCGPSGPRSGDPRGAIRHTLRFLIHFAVFSVQLRGSRSRVRWSFSLDHCASCRRQERDADECADFPVAAGYSLHLGGGGGLFARGCAVLAKRHRPRLPANRGWIALRWRLRSRRRSPLAQRRWTWYGGCWQCRWRDQDCSLSAWRHRRRPRARVFGDEECAVDPDWDRDRRWSDRRHRPAAQRVAAEESQSHGRAHRARKVRRW